MKPIVLVPEPIAMEGISLLNQHCTCVAPWLPGNGLSSGGSDRELRGQAEAIIVRLTRVTASDLSEMPNLRAIVKHGVGTENIDCQAATDRHVQVVITPDGVTTAVAELTITLILALARNLDLALAATTHPGNPIDRYSLTGVEVAGKSLAVVGLGRIGERVAHIASKGLGMEVHVYDPQVTESARAAGYIVHSGLDDLLEQADFLTLHVPLTDQNRRLLNRERLKRLRPNACVINTARGGLIDEEALVEALLAGSLAGAALDVTEVEPLPPDHPLFGAPRTILTPHIGSATSESLTKTAAAVARAVIGVIRGEAVDGLLNPEVLRRPQPVELSSGGEGI